MPKYPVIYHGILNPKGEHDTKDTTFFTQSQLKRLSNELLGIPIKIHHIHKGKDNKEIDPSGYMLGGYVNEKTGALHGSFFLCDTPNGEIAKVLTGEKGNLPYSHQMHELSMGYDIGLKDGKAVSNRLKEVSLCWKGAREGTKITKKIDLNKITSKTDSNDLKNLKKKIYNILNN